jgi:hypothetical protein
MHADISVTLVLPSGGARKADMPDDVPVGDLLAELTSLLKLPTVGPDGRPLGYRMDSKALGRELRENETLHQAGIPADDRLMITTDITAGAVSVSSSPRMRRLKKDFELIQEINARSDLISVKAEKTTGNLPPEKYIVTYKCKGIIGIDKKGNPKFGNKHEVEIYLHNQYPQRWPGMKWLTLSGIPISTMPTVVCALMPPGGLPAALWIVLVIMLGEMVQYKNYHDDPKKPPFPGIWKLLSGARISKTHHGAFRWMNGNTAS